MTKMNNNSQNIAELEYLKLLFIVGTATKTPEP